MPLRNKLKRQCKECEEMYIPNGKYGKLCEKCKEKVKEKAREKGWQWGNKRKEKN